MSSTREPAEGQQRQEPRPRTLASTGSSTWRIVPSHGIGVDLGPDVGVGAAPDEGQGSNRRPTKSLDRAEQPPQLRATPSYTARTRSRSGGAERQVVETAADGVVVDRRPLAVQPRREHGPVAPRRSATMAASVRQVPVARCRCRARRSVAREEHVLGQERQAGACRLVLVGDHVPTRDGGGDGGHVGDGVGLLERDVAADPRRRADVEVPVVSRATAPEPTAAECTSPVPVTTGTPAGEAELLGGGLGPQRAHDRGRGPQVGQLGSVEPRDLEQRCRRSRRRRCCRLSVTQWTTIESYDAEKTTGQACGSASPRARGT